MTAHLEADLVIALGALDTITKIEDHPGSYDQMRVIAMAALRAVPARPLVAADRWRPFSTHELGTICSRIGPSLSSGDRTAMQDEIMAELERRGRAGEP